MPRIAVLVPFAFDDAGLAKRRAQQDSVSWGPGIDFEFIPVKAGPSVYEGPHDWMIADLAMFEVGQRVAGDYDALIIDTMSDSGVEALRCAVGIPVIGPARACYHLALTLGSSFGVITQWAPWMAIYKKNMAAYGVAHQCAGIRHIDTPPDVKNLLGGKEDVVFPKLVSAGLELVEAGADVLILGSTTMHEAHAHLVAKMPVPVLNPGPVSYKVCEAVLGLGLNHSRQSYPAPLVPKYEMVGAMLDAAAAHEAG
jgi:allantoin racemase